MMSQSKLYIRHFFCTNFEKVREHVVNFTLNKSHRSKDDRVPLKAPSSKSLFQPVQENCSEHNIVLRAIKTDFHFIFTFSQSVSSHFNE